MPHLLDDRDLDTDARLALLEATWAIKHGGRGLEKPLLGRHLALVMTKPSLRTRVSFTVAIRDLGAEVVEVGSTNTKLGKGEDIQEFAAVLGRMVSAIIARVHAQADLEAIAEHSGVPVVNALSDLLHPCQALADAFTVWEHARKTGAPGSSSAKEFFARDHRWAYIGDGNNVAHSLILAAASLGVTLALACPPSRLPDAAILSAAQVLHRKGEAGILLGTNATDAATNASVVYTDTWVSMGQEGELSKEQIEAQFRPFSVDDALMAKAQTGALFMHCLPAEPGREVTAAILRGPQSVILDQAENRLWTSKSILADHVFKDGQPPA